MSQVRLDQVTKSFGSVAVIPPLDLVIADKEFVVLVGPSGCGKTTTLRMIAGLEQATSGEIRIGERDVTTLRPGLRNCSMVFQNYALYPHMTVAENIGYGMKVRGTPKEDINAAVANAARILNLGAYLNRKPSALSGGQRQRVAIGRAIVRQPDVFLFDEPLSNLDAKLRIEMRTEIKLLHRRLQTTIVYVTHDQVEAMTMADRVVVMNQGRIEQAADPITLYESPKNLFVAAFIGAPSMNFVEGRLEADGGGVVFRADGDVAITVPARMVKHLSAGIGQAVVLGIRPEHTMTADPAFPTIRVHVADIEPLGPHTLAIGKAGASAFTAQIHAASRVRPEDMIDVPIDPEKMHFFLKSTGEALRLD
ncbi:MULTISPECIES: ABC transporter ATP-binding protein [Rhizobium]|uniref:ABC transporter ATP-binding protein n=1 Tax=Rhizobium TaxID=379 RepID=UPI000A1F44C4|nr:MULTISPECIES: sn-glycerol-3-phosphate ABC transporter ATP-binding protein UgpC [Rhizobium]ARM90948.1 sn-glycerol-3-phosphate ABC transporter ATP-binding protein [Rhizobium sp. CIAT894]MBB4299537.1 multiple sugar transport system ATP-binding protein [Rhizobium leguminosarum]MBB4310975.1 multiple sugar transport system ATP-binding protein [Rhizobium leguminosarum]MBB4419913.1 multiple sugar transport system ATP-binding protein [Rhizobium leguminosarum]MBB4435091.1 multiple sugar transport sys